MPFVRSFSTHYLSDHRDGLPPSDCISCGQRQLPNYNGEMSSPNHYYCEACNVYFHDLCQEVPRKMRHPYHPQHPLSFTFVDKSGTLVSDRHVLDYFEEYGEVKFGSGHGKCHWCGQELGTMFYSCSICSFNLDYNCSILNPLPTIANPTSHEHALAFLPRPLLTPCDACGLVDACDSGYACFQCNYVVHCTCIDLPHVIKIPYHQHRLSHTPYLPPGKWSCEVCHQKVDVKYGAYFCTQGCSSVFHSKCATDKEIWDGQELEWEPEEPEETNDIEPFQKIGDEEILHFSHEHQLRFFKVDLVRDSHKQCQACVLPVDYDNFYNCMQCDFSLHATCASLPRKKDHVLHRHVLILDPLPQQEVASMECSACERLSSGFRYTCNKCNFKLDVGCASLPNLLNHRSHPHPLFIRRRKFHVDQKPCQRCHNICFPYYLNCICGCDFLLCSTCATFPDEVRYKYDDHLLSLCCGEENVRSPYWCEVCEKEINAEQWFYSCNACSVTLHVRCAFGFSMYMKYGQSLKYEPRELEIARNSSSTRPICCDCHDRCRETVFFKEDDQYFCSLGCARLSFL